MVKIGFSLCCTILPGPWLPDPGPLAGWGNSYEPQFVLGRLGRSSVEPTEKSKTLHFKHYIHYMFDL